MFVWNMSISFQLLFIIVSGVIFLYLREKSFKYYGLYNIFLIIYVISRSDDIYYGFQELMIRLLGRTDGIVFVQILNFFIQIVFYSFYSVFAFYFLDFEKNAKKYFKRSLWVIKFLAYLFFWVCSFMLCHEKFRSVYNIVYLPLYPGNARYICTNAGKGNSPFRKT